MLIRLMAVSLALCGWTPQAATELKLSAKREKTLRCRILFDEDTTMVPTGTTDKIINRLGWEFGLETRGPAGEGASLVRLSILRFTRDDGKQKVDTSKPDPSDPPQIAFLRALVGEHADSVIKPDGTVKEWRGIDELKTRFAERMRLKPDDPSLSGMTENLSGYWRDVLGRAFSIYPEKTVAPGSTWSRKLSVSQESVPYHSECAWTLSSRKDSRISLSGKYTLTPFPDADKRGRETKLVSKLSGDGVGTLEVDEDSGFPITGKITHQLSGTSTLEGMKAKYDSDVLQVTVRIKLAVEGWDGK